MNRYKIKLKHEQIKFLYESVTEMFQQSEVLEKIDHIAYWNIKSFLKRMHDKLYHLSTVRMIKSHSYALAIDMNEHQAILQLYSFGKNYIDTSTYLQMLYLDVFIQIDKQEINIRDEHKRLYPVPNNDIYKYQIDFNKSV